MIRRSVKKANVFLKKGGKNRKKVKKIHEESFQKPSSPKPWDGLIRIMPRKMARTPDHSLWDEVVTTFQQHQAKSPVTIVTAVNMQTQPPRVIIKPFLSENFQK